MNMDDVACVAVLTAVVVSLGMGAAGLLLDETRRGVTVAQECPLSHSTPSDSPTGHGLKSLL